MDRWNNIDNKINKSNFKLRGTRTGRMKCDKPNISSKPRNEKPKIFCVGFHKTGTTSLTHALMALGYTTPASVGNIAMNYVKNNQWDKIDEIVQKNDFFADHPWFNIWEELYERYPNAKFILTVRNPLKWIKSAIKWFNKDDIKKSHPILEMTYGKKHIDELMNNDDRSF